MSLESETSLKIWNTSNELRYFVHQSKLENFLHKILSTRLLKITI